MKENDNPFISLTIKSNIDKYIIKTRFEDILRQYCDESLPEKLKNERDEELSNEYQLLKDRINSALEYLSEARFDETTLQKLESFFNIGKDIGTYLHEPATKKSLEDQKRNRHLLTQGLKKEIEKKGLNKRNQILASLKEIAQVIATSLWKKDCDMRITDMAYQVFVTLDFELKKNINNDDDLDEFINLCLKYMPNKAESLKPWIREVAPESAKKRGRPSNK